MGMSGFCSTPCSATRRSSRIATALKPTGLSITPLIEAWAAKKPQVFPNYFAGSWGPECADHLLESTGHSWRNDLGRRG